MDPVGELVRGLKSRGVASVANGRKKGNNSKPPLDISPYNYCVQTSDCVVITGSLSGFQSGVVTNKNEAEILSQIINP